MSREEKNQGGREAEGCCRDPWGGQQTRTGRFKDECRSETLKPRLALVSGQMFLIDRFLGNTFLTFGLDVIKFMEDDQEVRIDPMIFVFPRMTKCSFSKFGTSGELERYDSLCILPINIVNEKIYIFLWFWFLLLVFLTFFVLLYRLMIILSPRMRAYLLCLRFRLINKEVINTIVRKSKMGDWFLFYMLGQNVDTLIFKEVMHELAKRLGHASKDFGEP